MPHAYPAADPTTATLDPHSDTLERRWEAWQTKGRARETLTRSRVRAAFATLVFIAGVVFLWLVTGG